MASSFTRQETKKEERSDEGEERKGGLLAAEALM